MFFQKDVRVYFYKRIFTARDGKRTIPFILITMGKFINPFTDFGFHRIFGQEVHKELLIDFLNQLFFGENRTSARMILNVGFIY